MSASPLKISTLQPIVPREPVSQSGRRQLFVTSVVTLIAMLNAIGLLLVLSRFAGDLSDILPRGPMLLAALTTTATVATIRIAWRRLFPLEVANRFDLKSSSYDWDAIIGWGSSLALALLAIGCCYPANYTSDWLIWFPALVADQFWRQTFFDAGCPAHSINNEPEEFDEELTATLAFPLDLELEAALLKNIPPQNRPQETEPIENTEQMVQQLYRVRDEQGQEIIYGTVRADFEAGQRTAVVHVGFCPPLSHIPEIEAESLPGSSARIKIVQTLAHGTRMDVRLPAPAETDRHIMIDLAATPAG